MSQHQHQEFGVEMRSAIEGQRLVGHAAVFNTVALIGGTFYEEMSRSAFDVALKTSDAIFVVNHDPEKLLGRQKSGTLKVGTDSTGLAFELELPNTTLGNDVREMVARGDLSEGSFRFVPGEVSRSTARDGKSMVTHTSIKHLRDLSLVTLPAYQGTNIQLRSLEIPDFNPSGNRSRLIRARHNLATRL